MTFAKRLKEERARLSLTQEAMAKAGGVSRRAQVSYEAGTSTPDARYLEGIAGVGADTMYVSLGYRLGDEVVRLAAAVWLLATIAKELGLRGDSFSPALNEISMLIPSTRVVTQTIEGDAVSGSDMPSATNVLKLEKLATQHVQSVFAQAGVPLEGARLAAILWSIDDAMKTYPEIGAIDPAKMTRIIMIAYRSAAPVGSINKSTVRDLLHLAS